MNDVAVDGSVPQIIGTPWNGGFFAGRILINGNLELHALIVSPRAEGDLEPIAWNASRKNVAGAGSFYDGKANTVAMAEAGSKLAKQILDLKIGGFDDWYLPSRDELELLYRHFKPGTGENFVWRNGDNPSSSPVGYPYTAKLPGQTSIADFRDDGSPEAFEEAWYWSSTQFAAAPEYAWCQYFYDGSQGDYHEVYSLRARAVRRVKL